MLNNALTLGLMGSGLTLLVTYVVHSSVLLLSAWIGLRLLKPSSDVLVERVWKFAAVAGVFTAMLQSTVWQSSSLLSMEYAVRDSAVVTPAGSTSQDHLPRDHHDNRQSRTKSRQPSGDSTRVIGARHSKLDRTELEFPLVIEANVNEPLDDREAQTNRKQSAVEQTGIELDVRSAGLSNFAHREMTGAGERDQLPAAIPISNHPNRKLPEQSVKADSVSAPVVSLFVAFVVAISIGLLRLFVLSLRFRRQCQRFQKLDAGEARRCLDKLIAKAKLQKPIELFESPNVDEPMAFGLFRWRIVIPCGVEQSLADGELRALLAHEMAHLVRGDGCWLWIGRLLCSCLPFQPLNFVARRQWQSAGEHQCDAWAVQHLVKPFLLARCLTSVAEWKLGQRAAAIGLSVSGNRTALSERIERLTERSQPVDPWGRPRSRRLQSVGSILVLALLAYFGPRLEFVDVVANGAPAADSPAAPHDAKDVYRSRRGGVRQPSLAEADALRSEVEQLRHDSSRLKQRLQQLPADSAARQLSHEIDQRTNSLVDRTHRVLRELKEPD